jgi:hypothetical protein
VVINEFVELREPRSPVRGSISSRANDMKLILESKKPNGLWE